MQHRPEQAGRIFSLSDRFDNVLSKFPFMIISDELFLYFAFAYM